MSKEATTRVVAAARRHRDMIKQRLFHAYGAGEGYTQYLSGTEREVCEAVDAFDIPTEPVIEPTPRV